MTLAWMMVFTHDDAELSEGIVILIIADEIVTDRPGIVVKRRTLSFRPL